MEFPQRCRAHAGEARLQLGGLPRRPGGKGGFRLSLRGYDPATDYFNIVKQDRGRRVEFSDPGRSLVLAKPSGAIAHKGGIRFATSSLDYRIFAEWLSNGAAPPKDDDARVEQLEILPVAFDPARRPDSADPGPAPATRTAGPKTSLAG